MSLSGDLSPVDTRQVVRSFTDNGDGTQTPNFSQVLMNEIGFVRWGAVDISTDVLTIGIGAAPITVNVTGDGSQFDVGDEIQLTPHDAPSSGFMYGTLLSKTGSALSIIIQEVSTLIDTFAIWDVQVVNRPKAWLEVDVSLTSINPTTGGEISLTVNTGKHLPAGGGILLRPAISGKRHIVILGIVVSYNTATGALVVQQLSTNATVSESIAVWDVALIDAPPVSAGAIGTSASSVAIGGGGVDKTFTTQSGKSWVAGVYVRASDTTNAGNFLQGVVKSYSGTTLVLRIVNQFGGSGSPSSWLLQQVAPALELLDSVNNVNGTGVALRFAASGLTVDSTSANPSSAAGIKANTGVAAGTTQRDLLVNLNDANRTVDLSGNLTVSSAATISGTHTGTSSGTNTGDQAVNSGYLFGGILSNNGSDPTNDIDIQGGYAASTSDPPTLITMPGYTKRLDADWAPGTGNGFRNSGAAIANTIYYVYAVCQNAGANPDYYAHTSTNETTVLTALQVETGGSAYTKVRRLGFIVRAGGVIRPFTQRGDHFEFTTPPLEIDTTALTTSRSTFTLASVPPNMLAELRAVVAHASATVSVIVTPVSEPDAAPSNTVSPLTTIRLQVGGISIAGELTIRVDASSQVAARSSASSTTLRAVVRSVIDTRGRLD